MVQEQLDDRECKYTDLNEDPFLSTLRKVLLHSQIKAKN